MTMIELAHMCQDMIDILNLKLIQLLRLQSEIDLKLIRMDSYARESSLQKIQLKEMKIHSTNQ